MAQRRLFSPDIVRSDAFLDMPASSRELYFQLCMDADDDGFVNPKRVIRMVNASGDDLKMLILKRFALPFQSGVIVIKHWLIHNSIRRDRYKETQYTEEKKLLTTKGNGAYTELATIWQPSGNHMLPQDKVSEVKLSKAKDAAAKPKKVKTAITFEQILNHKLWPKIKEKYIDRDYEYQFGLMIDWWTNKGRVPINISSFTNWLEHTNPDPRLASKRQMELERERNLNAREEVQKPVSEEAFKKLRGQMNTILKPIN